MACSRGSHSAVSGLRECHTLFNIPVLDTKRPLSESDPPPMPLKNAETDSAASRRAPASPECEEPIKLSATDSAISSSCLANRLEPLLLMIATSGYKSQAWMMRCKSCRCRLLAQCSEPKLEAEGSEREGWREGGRERGRGKGTYPSMWLPPRGIW